MKPSTLSLLFAALTIHINSPAARACQYCRMAADDPEMARLAAAMHAKSGDFPLNNAISKFQPVAPAATLTAPPSATNIATRTADLTASGLPVAATHRPLPPSASPSPSPSRVKNTTDRWANGGLLGLLGLAGFFGWRTRRSAGEAS